VDLFHFEGADDIARFHAVVRSVTDQGPNKRLTETKAAILRFRNEPVMLG